MRANVVKTVVNSVPHEGIDAVGVERTIPENPLRRNLIRNIGTSLSSTTSPRNYAVTSWKSA